MLRRTRADKEGFSLIELVITIAIMAIVVGGVALTLGLLRSADSQGAAQRLNSSLNDLKTQNMANAYSVYMNVYRHDDNYYVKYTKNNPLTTIDTDDLGKKIGDSKIIIKFHNNEIVEDRIFSLTIKKSDGSFGTKYTVGNSGYGCVPVTLPSPAEFSVQARSGGTVYTVILVSNTGRHYVDV